MAESHSYSGNGHTATIADPNNITRDECLALARCGADAWNAWRDKFQIKKITSDQFKNVADFSGVDFRVVSINFFGLRLGDYANFSEAIFGSDCIFVGHIFGSEVNFSKASFEYSALFSKSVFGHAANFTGTTFGEGGADFDGAQFGDWAKFCGSVFQGRANFQGAVFGSFALFLGAIFVVVADFSAARFGTNAGFMGKSWRELEYWFEKYSISTRKSDDSDGLNPKTFCYCNFDGCFFEGVVNFSDREFLGSVSFSTLKREFRINQLRVAEGGSQFGQVATGTVEEVVFPEGLPVRFGEVPVFHGCKLHQDFSFDGAVFPSPTGNDASIHAFRTLKLAFSQQQASREEQRFFRLEMAEEAKAAERSRDPSRWLYVAYRELADFGFSVRRPAILLIAVLSLALPLYAWQAGLHPCWPADVACSGTGPLIQFAAAHAFPGFEKFAEAAVKVLYPDGLGVWTVLTLLLHKAVSLLALFLIGLALRNLFKMK